jgi:hypothetical protein
MVRREVEQLEVILIRLDIAGAINLEAHVGPNLINFPQSLTVELFVKEKLDALAGLRPALLDNARELPGTRILDGRFTAVQQAIGTRPGNEAASAFLQDFVAEARTSGLVQSLIDRHGVTGKLHVPSG